MASASRMIPKLFNRRLSSSDIPAFETCSGGCGGADVRRLKESSFDTNSGFMKTIDKKYPLVKFKPQTDRDGNELDTLIVTQKIKEVSVDGKEETKEIVLTTDDLKQKDGQTYLFVPQPNTFEVHWVWLNLEKRSISNIDMDVSAVSLPEIESINAMLLKN